MLYSEAIAFGLSPLSRREAMPASVYNTVLAELQKCEPSNIRHNIDLQGDTTRIPLALYAMYFDYIVLCGRRYTAEKRSATGQNSLIQARAADGRHRVGRLLEIFRMDQEGVSKRMFLLVQWYQLQQELDVPTWNSL